ncbi:hypothetical protein PENTCL1PPCAC_21507, partial [Pristionchus entomophagus]
GWTIAHCHSTISDDTEICTKEDDHFIVPGYNSYWERTDEGAKASAIICSYKPKQTDSACLLTGPSHDAMVKLWATEAIIVGVSVLVVLVLSLAVCCFCGILQKRREYMDEFLRLAN